MDCEICGGPIIQKEGQRQADFERLKTCSKKCNAARLTAKQIVRDKRDKQMNALKANRITRNWNDLQRFISGYIPLT